LKNKTKFIVAFVVVFAALGYFVVSSMSGDKLYYKEIQALLDDPASVNQRGLKIAGAVLDENFAMDKFARTASFDMTDASGGVLSVAYNGTIPDAFEQGAEVVVQGKYDAAAGVFHANSLLAKCPSKYEAEGEVHPDDIEKRPSTQV
jgi:cytochrome c-type biogenesis protein CcmE